MRTSSAGASICPARWQRKASLNERGSYGKSFEGNARRGVAHLSEFTILAEAQLTNATRTWAAFRNGAFCADRAGLMASPHSYPTRRVSNDQCRLSMAMATLHSPYR